MKELPAPKVSSFRNTAIRTMAIVVIPLFFSVVLFIAFTIASQRRAVKSSHLTTLAAYYSQAEETVLLASQYLQNMTASNQEFQSILYARTKTEVFAASRTLAKIIRPLMQANHLISGFYTYSKAFDYYHPSNLESYPAADAAIIKDAILAATEQGAQPTKWTFLTLSDRIVLLATSVLRETSAAVVLDLGAQEFTGLEEENIIFSVTPDGTLYKSTGGFQSVPLPEGGQEVLVAANSSGRRYELVSFPYGEIGGRIFYAAPVTSFLQQLSLSQKVLLLVMLILLGVIPCYWLVFRRMLLEPLVSLTATMKALKKGATDLRVPQNSRLEEVNQIAWTVNAMLDSLQEQQAVAYEQKLEIQRAQLQYLQLQIRPHFYLNCLNIIFSLAVKKDFKSIQKVVLDLSDYLRGMFRDSSKLISLSTELDLVQSYIRIQQASAQQKPLLHLELSADVIQATVPPLCVLTFVENSFKHHASADAPVEIRIKCGKLSSPEGDWLNIVICDNSGGFSQMELDRLNHPAKEVCRESHVGIFNVIQRMHMLYKDQAAISFYNQEKGGCVDVFLPLRQNVTEDGETT